MIGKRIGFASCLALGVFGALSNPKSADQISNDESFGVKAGIVVSIKEDFLARGQNELLTEFVAKLNRLGEETNHEVDLGAGLNTSDLKGIKVQLSHLKVVDVGNLTTSAPKLVDMQAECGCIKGSIGEVDKIVVSLDFEFNFDLYSEPIKGTASATLYGFKADYTVTPTVVNIDEAFSFHEQGMLHLKLDSFKISAGDAPVSVAKDSRMSTEVKAAFEEILSSILVTGEAFGPEALKDLEDLVNAFLVTYDQHTRLYEDTLEIDYQLVGDGIVVTDDYMSLIMDGTFHSVLGDGQVDSHENEEKHDYKSLLPFHMSERGPVQVIISDYTLNSLLNTALDLQWYDFSETLSGDAINGYISHFAQAFGSMTEVKVIAKPVKDTQKLRISGKTGLTTLVGLVDMHV